MLSIRQQRHERSPTTIGVFGKKPSVGSAGWAKNTHASRLLLRACLKAWHQQNRCGNGMRTVSHGRGAGGSSDTQAVSQQKLRGLWIDWLNWAKPETADCCSFRLTSRSPDTTICFGELKTSKTARLGGISNRRRHRRHTRGRCPVCSKAERQRPQARRQREGIHLHERAHGPGAVSLDAQGRLFAVRRERPLMASGTRR